MQYLKHSDAGCWLDGHQGWHNNYRVIDRAFEHGWKPNDYPGDENDTRAIRDAYATRADSVTLPSSGEKVTADDFNGLMIDQGGIVECATDYLNTVAPPGFVVEWDMGELSLLDIADTDAADEFGGPHVNYPHTPGYLPDCGACEARCYCGRDTGQNDYATINGLTPCVYCGTETPEDGANE